MMSLKHSSDSTQQWPGSSGCTQEPGLRGRNEFHVLHVGGWRVFCVWENVRGEGCMASPTKGTEDRNCESFTGLTDGHVSCSGISLQRWEAAEMDRKRIPVQPFNYGKVGKGKETKYTGMSSWERRAAFELLFVGLQRATAFSDQVLSSRIGTGILMWNFSKDGIYAGKVGRGEKQIPSPRLMTRIATKEYQLTTKWTARFKM